MKKCCYKLSGLFFSILLGSCHSQSTASAAKAGRDLNAVIEIPFGVPSMNQTTTLRIPEGYIDRWVMGGKIEPYPAFIELHASGVNFLPEMLYNLEDFRPPKSFKQIIGITLWGNALGGNSNNLLNITSHSGSNMNASWCKYFPEQKAFDDLVLKKVNLETCKNPNDKNSDLQDARDSYFSSNYNQSQIRRIDCVSKDILDNGLYSISGKPSTSMNPSCKHLVYYKSVNIYLEMSYPRNYLEQYKELETNALNLIQSFLLTPNGKNYGY